MTPADLDALNRRIFTAHPELADGWKPGQQLHPEMRGCEHTIWCAHEVPPPNIMDPAVFVRVLVETKPYEIGYDEETDKWACELRPMDDRIFADTPQLALGLAIDQMGKK